MSSLHNINTTARREAFEKTKQTVVDNGIYDPSDDESIAQYVILVERNTAMDKVLDAVDTNEVSQEHFLNLLRQQKIIADRLAVFVNQLGLSPKSRIALQTRKNNENRRAKKSRYLT